MLKNRERLFQMDTVKKKFFSKIILNMGVEVRNKKQ